MGARLLPTVLGITLLTGCAAQYRETALPPEHPANPAAATSLASPRSTTLRTEPVEAEIPASAPAPAMHHDHGAMNQNRGDAANDQAGHSNPGAAGDGMTTKADAGDEHVGHAAGADMASGKPAAAASATGMNYVCPMHKQVKSNKPGKCPKCGMTLKVKPIKAVGAGAASPPSAPTSGAAPATDTPSTRATDAAASESAGGHEGHDAKEGNK